MILLVAGFVPVRIMFTLGNHILYPLPTTPGILPAILQTERYRTISFVRVSNLPGKFVVSDGGEDAVAAAAGR